MTNTFMEKTLHFVSPTYYLSKAKNRISLSYSKKNSENFPDRNSKNDDVIIYATILNFFYETKDNNMLVIMHAKFEVNSWCGWDFRQRINLQCTNAIIDMISYHIMHNRVKRYNSPIASCGL